jgi:phospholipase/carboxylesterase
MLSLGEFEHSAELVSHSEIIQRPSVPAEQLLLLFHGVGGSVGEMLPLGKRLAEKFPRSFIVSVEAAHRSDLGAGHQWFSVRGISDLNRPARVAAAMPAFISSVRAWQAIAALDALRTTLVGFSQGAIMALESTREPDPPARRIVSVAGRYAREPSASAHPIRFHLLHGTADPVIPYSHTLHAAKALAAQGAQVTTDLIESAAHEISPQIETALIARLAHDPAGGSDLRQAGGSPLERGPSIGDNRAVPTAVDSQHQLKRSNPMAFDQAFFERCTPRAIALLRIVAAFLFLQHGTAKLLHVPHVAMFDSLPLFSLIGLAGTIEIVGSLLLLIGLWVRPAAFLMSGEMAFAYFIGHAPHGDFLSPMLNQGEGAVLYCFIFLMLAAAGAGAWSVDAIRARR